MSLIVRPKKGKILKSCSELFQISNYRMVVVDLSKHSDSDSEPVIDKEEVNVVTEIFDSTSLKIQNSKGEIQELSKKKEREKENFQTTG